MKMVQSKLGHKGLIGPYMSTVHPHKCHTDDSSEIAGVTVDDDDDHDDDQDDDVGRRVEAA